MKKLIKKVIPFLFLASSLAPALANAKKPSWAVNLKTQHVWMESGSDELSQFEFFSSKGIYYRKAWPYTVYAGLGIEKYFGNFSVGLNAIAALPQKIEMSGIYCRDRFNDIEWIQSNSLQFSDYSMELALKYNIPSGPLYDFSLGIDIGMVYKKADLSSKMEKYYQDNLTGSSSAEASYNGYGTKLDLSLLYNLKFSKEWHFTAGVDITLDASGLGKYMGNLENIGKINMKRTEYKTEHNGDVGKTGLKNQLKHDQRGSFRFEVGIKKKF